MFIEELPQEYVNVLITYSCDVYVRDKYYGHTEFRTVTRLAFYSKSNGYYNSVDKWIETPEGYFSVPKMFQKFKGSLLPYTFQQYARVAPDKIEKWEPAGEINNRDFFENH